MIRVSVLIVAVMFSVSTAFAATSLKFSDSASTKIKKTPIGTAIEQPTYKSTMQIVIPAPGLDPSKFTVNSALIVNVSSGTSAGSSDYSANYLFGEDSKFQPGAKGLKIVKTTVFGIKLTTFRTIQVKFGKEQITISIKNGYESLFAQQFLNYGTLGVVQYPEGPGTGTRSLFVDVTVGDFKKSFSNVPYKCAFTNKPKDVNGTTYWVGSAKGSAVVAE
jgi:hypothetical protein